MYRLFIHPETAQSWTKREGSPLHLTIWCCEYTAIPVPPDIDLFDLKVFFIFLDLFLHEIGQATVLQMQTPTDLVNLENDQRSSRQKLNTLMSSGSRTTNLPTCTGIAWDNWANVAF